MARRHGPTPAYRPGQRIGVPVIPRPPEWTRRAVCTPEQADRLFYADSTDPDEHDPATAAARQTEAQALCAACPVRAACAAEMRIVDQQHDRHGVWAGLLPTDRAPRKRARRTPNKTNAAIAARAAADPRGPIAPLAEADFDADVLRFADQGHTTADIATWLNRTVRDVDLARLRAQQRRRRVARNAQRRRTTVTETGVAA